MLLKQIESSKNQLEADERKLDLFMKEIDYINNGDVLNSSDFNIMLAKIYK